MPNIEYLVMRRSGEWWVTRDADRSGPFISEQAAINSALTQARMDFRSGKTARVSVDEPNDGIPIVYDSSHQA